MKRGSLLAPYLYLGPVILLGAIFVYWPLLYTFYLATVKWNLVATSRPFVGLDNFVGVYDSSLFADAARNTIIYIFGSIPLKVFLPLAVAVFIWMCTPRTANLYKTVIFLPVLASFAAVAVIWLWLLNPIGGYFSIVLRKLDLSMPNLLYDTHYALATVLGVSAWKILGFNTLLYLAGLTGINRGYAEAMRIDGANDRQIFRYLVWPLLTPTTMFVLITTVIFSVQQVFTPIDMMTKGGPSNATTNLFYMVYQMAFQNLNIGYGAAATVVLFVLLMTITFAKLKLLDRFVKYEDR